MEVVHRWTWAEFYAAMYPLPVTRASYQRSPLRTNAPRGPSNYEGRKSRHKLNPAFSQVSLDNPIFQHYLSDKIGDFERSLAISTSVTVATAPWLTPLSFSGPQGFVTAMLIRLIIAAPIVSYANTLDLYSDVAALAATREIHGHKISGRSHEY